MSDKSYFRNYYLKNIEKFKAYRKSYRSKNRLKLIERDREYRMKNGSFKWRIEKKCQSCYRSFMPIVSFQVYCKECQEVKKKESGSLKRRFRVLLRDNFTCYYCGRKSPEVVLEVDHFYPESKGGENNLDNYRTSCRDCNQGKKDLVIA